MLGPVVVLLCVSPPPPPPPPPPSSVQLLAVSDLFTERNQFDMMFSTLMELQKLHPMEDEILNQYLVPAICKAAAVLGMVSERWRERERE